MICDPTWSLRTLSYAEQGSRWKEQDGSANSGRVCSLRKEPPLPHPDSRFPLSAASSFPTQPPTVPPARLPPRPRPASGRRASPGPRVDAPRPARPVTHCSPGPGPPPAPGRRRGERGCAAEPRGRMCEPHLPGGAGAARGGRLGPAGSRRPPPPRSPGLLGLPPTMEKEVT